MHIFEETKDDRIVGGETEYNFYPLPEWQNESSHSN